VPGIVAFMLQTQTYPSTIFFFFLSLFKPLKLGIYQKFKAQAHLLASVPVSQRVFVFPRVRFSLCQCAFVFPGVHFLLHKCHDHWHTLYHNVTSFMYHSSQVDRERKISLQGFE
jgi:hypothetical protein